MAKIIQVRVGDNVMESADIMEIGDIPFLAQRNENRDTALIDAIERHRAGTAQFVTAEESVAILRSAIDAGAEHAG